MQESLEDYLKLAKTVKQEEPLNFSKEVVVTAQLKKECDSRAMKIVEFSIEGKLRPEVFTRCLPFINQSHYQDIVEERSITKLCGYSLCGKRIPEMPKKQYLISTKSNKVYDITERKKFCSNFCYKASLHIKKQIDNSPLWLRKLEDIPEYKLLNPSDGGLPGEYVGQGMVKSLANELKFASINAFARASLGDLENSNGAQSSKKRSFKKSSQLKSTMQTIKENDMEEEILSTEATRISRRLEQKKTVRIIKKETYKIVSLPSIEENEEQRLQSEKENEDVNQSKLIEVKQERPEDDALSDSTNILKPKNEETTTETKKMDEIKSEPSEKKKLMRSKSKPLDVEGVVKKAVNDWLTLETCIFIHGEEKVKEILSKQKLSDYFEELHVQDLKMEQQLKYMEICKRLQLQEMADEKFDNALVRVQKLKPLPDYHKLKEDTKDMKLKVKAFYGGSMYEETDKNFPIKAQNEPEDVGAPAVLPPVDVNSQNLLRRKIFLNSLSKAIQQLLQALGASYSAVLSDVQALVKTFRLRADNITFKPLVWNYIALVLVDLLSLKDQYLRAVLEERAAQEYIQVLFQALPGQKGFITDVLANIRNIEGFVQKYITKAVDM